MNYDSEIDRMIDGDDFYMKGVALRHKAIKNIKICELKEGPFLISEKARSI